MSSLTEYREWLMARKGNFVLGSGSFWQTAVPEKLREEHIKLQSRGLVTTVQRRVKFGVYEYIAQRARP